MYYFAVLVGEVIPHCYNIHVLLRCVGRGSDAHIVIHVLVRCVGRGSDAHIVIIYMYYIITMWSSLGE